MRDWPELKGPENLLLSLYLIIIFIIIALIKTNIQYSVLIILGITGLPYLLYKIYKKSKRGI